MSKILRCRPLIFFALWTVFRLSVPALAYDVHAPVYPVAYTDPQKDTQREAGREIIRQINAAVKSGAHEFTVPPGVYRISANKDKGNIGLWKVKGFTLRMASVEFILENGGSFLYPIECSDISIVGPVKFDTDTLSYTQGKLLTYNSSTGDATAEIMPGYEIGSAEKGTVDAFSPSGIYLANPSWASFTNLKVMDIARRLVQFKLGAKDAIFTDIYKPGALIALRLHGSQLFLSSQKVHNLMVKDVDIYTGAGFMWGGGTGDFRFVNVRGIRRPGTNRLMGSGGCQAGNYGGNVTFDRCEFSNTADDIVDYYGGGLFLCERQENTRSLVTWGGSLEVGDTINVYDHAGFHPIASAIVTAVSKFKDAVLQADAHRLVKDVLHARDGDDRDLQRVTLDRDVIVAAGDYAENASSNRPNHFVVRHCYFHDCGVRVMIQGFRHGLFENNRFERISGGLSLTCDAWWWEGPTCQDIIVRDNIFTNTAFRNAWGTGKAALTIGAGWGEDKGGVSHGCAFHGAVVTGNAFLGSSTGAVFISNTDHVVIEKNRMNNSYALASSTGAVQLVSVLDARVSENIFTGCPGLNISAVESKQISILRNVFRNACHNTAAPPKDLPDAVICIQGCANTDVAGNDVDGTDAETVIWVKNSSGTTLTANHARNLMTPGAVFVRSEKN